MGFSFFETCFSHKLPTFRNIIEGEVQETLSAIVSLLLPCDSWPSQSATNLAKVFALDSREETEGH